MLAFTVGLFRIHSVGTRTFGWSVIEWLPVKFSPTNTGAGPDRLFGSDSRTWTCGAWSDMVRASSRTVALPPKASLSSKRTFADTFAGTAG